MENQASENFVALTRDMPRNVRAVRGALLGALILGAGSFVLYGYFLEDLPFYEGWIMLAVGGAFILVGLIMLLAAIQQGFALVLPEPTVSIDTLPVGRGERVLIRVRQPGPIQLNSLSARLVCEVIESRVYRGRRTDYSTYVVDQKIPLCGVAEAARGGLVEVVAPILAPTTADASRHEGRRRILWRIEIWGDVRHWVDYMHPYPIEVR